MKILKTIEEYTDALLDLIYPSETICFMCNNTLEKDTKYGLCRNCYNNLSFIPDHHCIKCSIPLRMIEDGPTCEQCTNSNYYFDRVISAVKYEKDAKILIYRLKYSGHTYLATAIGYIMADKLKEEGIREGLIIPVPLYKGKEKERGFNQAVLISKYIAKETGILLNTDALIRIEDTKVMYNLTKGEKLKNVENAFEVANQSAIIDKDILLIDDILTTGSTANACSKELINSGAKSVTVLTFAR